MGRPTLRLQAVLSAVTIVVTTLSLGIVVSLLMFTGYLHRASMSLANSVESIGLLDEAEVDLLLHDRTPPGTIRQGIESDLRRRLTDARRFTTASSEGEALTATEVAVERYLASAQAGVADAERNPALLKAAYDGLDRLVDYSVVNARRYRDLATYSEGLAKWVAVSTGVAVLLFSCWLLWWLRSRAFRPVFALANSIERFAHGDRDARAEETGPGELREMARRFNQMADALATQRQAQLNFLGGVAHDLRNPLSALRLSVAMIKPDQPLPPEPKIRRTLALVERQIGHLERMVGDFLDIARIESGQLAVRLQSRDACRLVRETVELFEATAPGRALTVHLPKNPLQLTCDPTRLAQVLSNLISNAVKYAPDQSPIDVSLNADDERKEVVIAVRDRGRGISAEDQRHMFEPFRRFEVSKQNIPGVGLGLFVARQIVRAHGGRIDVSSTPGQGTTIRVHLPTDHQAGPREGDESGPGGPGVGAAENAPVSERAHPDA